MNPTSPNPTLEADSSASHLPRQLMSLLQNLIPLLVIILIVFAGVRIFFMPYQIVGASMSPALANGDRLFVNRTAYSQLQIPTLGTIAPFKTPQRGDIIVLKSDITHRDTPYIKRIIALPGETITFTEGIVLINGDPLVEDYIDGAVSNCRRRPTCAMTVPEGAVYVLGDNRTDSEDSRVFGPVPMEDIVGKAFFSSWPVDGIGPIHAPDYGGN